jgi:hypothetical protein
LRYWPSAKIAAPLTSVCRARAEENAAAEPPRAASMKASPALFTTPAPGQLAAIEGWMEQPRTIVSSARLAANIRPARSSFPICTAPRSSLRIGHAKASGYKLKPKRTGFKRTSTSFGLFRPGRCLFLDVYFMGGLFAFLRQLVRFPYFRIFIRASELRIYLGGWSERWFRHVCNPHVTSARPGRLLRRNACPCGVWPRASHPIRGAIAVR